MAPVKHGLYATTRGLQLRNRRLRGHVSRLIKAHPELATKPKHLVRRYVEVDSLAAIVWNVLYDVGPLNDEGEPRRLLNDYRLLIVELRTLAQTLGLMEPSSADPLADLLGKGRHDGR
jgi:hypothetical protein